MLEQTDKIKVRAMDYGRLPGSRIEVPKDAQLMTTIPFSPKMPFDQTTFGWRRKVPATRDPPKDSYSETYYPERQIKYIAEDLFWKIKKDAAAIIQRVWAHYLQDYTSAYCCDQGSFWLIIALLLCLFGGIGLYVYAQGGNEENANSAEDYKVAAGVMTFGSFVALITVVLFRKFQGKRRHALLKRMMHHFEMELNRLKVMQENGNRWKHQFIGVIQFRIDRSGAKMQGFMHRKYRIFLYRKGLDLTVKDNREIAGKVVETEDGAHIVMK